MRFERKPTPPLNRGDYRVASVAGIIALLVYTCTLAPTVTGEDSGELIGAAWTLGVPHPPGYPLWTLLAHTFTWLPFGNPAWRVNFFSAACGAGTVALLVLAALSLTRNRMAALAAALIFAFSRVFWEQALIAEVYTLNTLFITLLLLIGLRGFRAEAPSGLYAMALLAGLGTGVHNTLILLVPFWAVLAWHQMSPPMRRSLPLHAKCLALFLCALAIHAYLPLAARHQPAVNWGTPDTLERWLAVLRRDQFAFMIDQYPRSVSRFAGQLATMTGFWFRDFLGLGALLGLWGGLLLFRRDRFMATFLVVAALATVISVTWMQNFEPGREWLWVMRVFLLPAELFTALGIACALAWGAEKTPRLRAFLGGLAVAALLMSLGLHGAQSKRGYTYAEDYARNILATLPEKAIYVPGADHQAFPVMYLQAVEGLRPDVTLLRKYGYLDLFSVPGLAQANPDTWERHPRRRYEPEILGWLLANTDRPLVLSRQVPIQGAEATFVPLGLLVQALRPGETAVPGRSLDALVWRNPLPEKPVAEYSLSLFQYDVAFARAQECFALGKTSEALAHVEAAAAFGHREPEILNNLGVLCGRYGAYDSAAACFREVLSTQPDFESAKANLERVERKRSK
jgi:tetratricopeptide (TPR) repeat protein